MEWLIVASAGVRVAGTLWAADQRADQMEEQARLAALQAEIALAQAQFTSRMQRKAGREQAAYLRRESQRRAGRAVVGVAEAGIELAGSPALALAEQIHRDEHGAAQAITNARMRAFATESQGRSEAATAETRHDALLEQAGITRYAGFLEAIGIGLAGAAHYQSVTGGSGGAADAFAERPPSYVNPSGYTGEGPYSGF